MVKVELEEKIRTERRKTFFCRHVGKPLEPSLALRVYVDRRRKMSVLFLYIFLHEYKQFKMSRQACKEQKM